VTDAVKWCHGLNPAEFTFHRLGETIAKNARDQFNETQLRAILVQIEYVICTGLFAKLRVLEANKFRLQDEEKEYCRYKAWFIGQFSLDPASCAEAI
jgi:hypothetical protein